MFINKLVSYGIIMIRCIIIQLRYSLKITLWTLAGYDRVANPLRGCIKSTYFSTITTNDLLGIFLPYAIHNIADKSNLLQWSSPFQVCTFKSYHYCFIQQVNKTVIRNLLMVKICISCKISLIRIKKYMAGIILI